MKPVGNGAAAAQVTGYRGAANCAMARRWTTILGPRSRTRADGRRPRRVRRAAFRGVFLTGVMAIYHRGPVGARDALDLDESDRGRGQGSQLTVRINLQSEGVPKSVGRIPKRSSCRPS